MLVDKLFNYHLSYVDGFKDFATYLFHWCDQRKILDDKYLPVNAFKLILICSLNQVNIPNLIEEYRKNFEQDKAE